MANVTKSLSGSDTFQQFSHTLYGWVGQLILDPTKEEELVGFEVISNPIPASEGEVNVTPSFNDVLDNSTYSGAYTATSIAFKGIYQNQTEFENEYQNVLNGMAYYDIDLDEGRVYYNTSYHTISYTNIQFSTAYNGKFGAGLFPNTSISWKNIITNEKFSKRGWPPPNDPMTRFIFAINVDPGTFKGRDIKIRYDVKITEDGEDPAFRSDVYTYTKQIQNTMSIKISDALKEFFDKFPPMDYTTGEIIEDASSA